MHIFCKLKEKADRAKKARALLSNRSKIKNFIIEFEINGRTIYETVDNKDHANALSKMIEFFYGNYFDIIISSFYFLGFEINRRMTGDLISKRTSNILLENDGYYAGEFKAIFELSNIWAEEYENSYISLEIMNSVYNDTVKLDRISFINSYPNFCLIFRKINTTLDLFVEILHKIKKEFSYKKMEDIYNDTLDVFIRMLNEKRETSDKDLFVLIDNLSIIIYYNFRIVFCHDSTEIALLSFKEAGWSWEIPIKEEKSAVYVYEKSISEIEDISEKIISHIKEKHVVTDEYVSHAIRYILYQCVANIVMMSQSKYSKTLNEMFFAKFMELVKDDIEPLYSTDRYYNTPFKFYYIAIPKDTKKLLISPKQKSILIFINNLFTIIRNENNYQKINYKNTLAKYSQNKKTLYIFLFFVMIALPCVIVWTYLIMMLTQIILKI